MFFPKSVSAEALFFPKNVSPEALFFPKNFSAEALFFPEIVNSQALLFLVIASAGTVFDNNSSISVFLTNQTKRGIRSLVIPYERILITVVIKFTAPKID